MAIKVSECLFEKEPKMFREIENKANMVLMITPVFRLIGSNLKVFIKSYAEKNSVHLKLLYLPFHDDQVWGIFYQQKGIYFIVINSDISINKQNVALAHEFYHFIISLEEDKVSAMDILKENSVQAECSMEDKKANAFSSCLLMPKDIVNVLLENKAETVEEKLFQVKLLMDVFVVPYKTAVIRLFELGCLSLEEAEYFIQYTNSTLRDELEKDNHFLKSVRWNNSMKNYIDIDDLPDLIKENVEFEFISASKADKCMKKVEEILAALKGSSE